MITDHQRSANIAASKIAGYEHELDRYVTWFNVETHVFVDGRCFNIYKNAEDCLEVVRRLGNLLYTISASVNINTDKHNGWFYYSILDDENGKLCETYEEAVGEACLRVIKQ